MKRIYTICALLATSVCTAQTPKLLKDIKPGYPDAVVYPNLGVANNMLFIPADDGVNGIELWMSDGTPANTQFLQDVHFGTGSSYLGVLPSFFRTKYFCTLDNGVNGGEMYSFTGPGTVSLFYDFNPGTSSSYANVNFELNGDIYFSAVENQANTLGTLFKSNGTTAGTAPLLLASTRLYSREPAYIKGSTAFLSASTTAYGGNIELYKTDGTIPGTALVKDIKTSGGSNPALFTKLNTNEFLFAAEDDTHGIELFKSDGTAAGTVLVKDITPGAGSTTFHGMYYWNNKVYIAADDGVHGIEVWVSDGTEAGTMLLKDINPSGTSLIGTKSSDFIGLGNWVLFEATDGTQQAHGAQLWRTDGTQAGTVMIKEIAPGGGSFLGLSGLHTTRNFNGGIYFEGHDNTYGSEIWYSNGTPAGTHLMCDLNPGTGNGIAPASMFAGIGNRVFFVGDDGSTGREVYYFDIPPASVNDIDQPVNITAYPNPTSGNTTLSFGKNVAGLQIEVLNTLGQVIITETASHTDKFVIHLENQPAGAYYTRIIADGDTKNIKLIKY